MTTRREPERHVHERFRLLAAQAVDGWIHPDDAAELEAHLATCEACRADQRAMLADHAWLATPSRVDPPSAHVREAVLVAARAPRVPRVGAPPRPWDVLVAASLAIVIIGAGILLATRPGLPAGANSDRPGATGSLPPDAPETCVRIPDGLSARWPFDGPTDRVTGLPMTLVGGPRVERGIVGSGLNLAGPGMWAEVPDTGVSELGTADFTIAVWVRFTGSVANQVLVERWRLASPVAGWTLTTIDNNEIRLAVATGLAENDGEFGADTVGAGLTTGRWHHVVARHAGRGFAIFVDGVHKGSSSQLPQEAAVDLFLADPMLLGHRGGGDLRDFDLRGDLDELLIWNDRALGDRAILELHRAGAAGFCEAAAGAGYEGAWVGIDCAAGFGTIDCARWGDASTIRVVIGPGEHPAIEYRDESVPGCGPAGGAAERVATGVGHFEGVHLWAEFTNVSCSAPSETWANPMAFYTGPGGEPELWVDPDGDGWGHTLQRE